jgi:hypothetical protein
MIEEKKGQVLHLLLTHIGRGDMTTDPEDMDVTMRETRNDQQPLSKLMIIINIIGLYTPISRRRELSNKK